jgi:hypothetical protein
LQFDVHFNGFILAKNLERQSQSGKESPSCKGNFLYFLICNLMFILTVFILAKTVHEAETAQQKERESEKNLFAF